MNNLDYPIKLFKVEKIVSPELGKVQVDKVGYFLAIDISIVEHHIIKNISSTGTLKHYYSMDREEVEYVVKEIEVERLM